MLVPIIRRIWKSTLNSKRSRMWPIIYATFWVCPNQHCLYYPNLLPLRHYLISFVVWWAGRSCHLQWSAYSQPVHTPTFQWYFDKQTLFNQSIIRGWAHYIDALVDDKEVNIRIKYNNEKNWSLIYSLKQTLVINNCIVNYCTIIVIFPYRYIRNFYNILQTIIYSQDLV